jgi:hypothetical protein
MSKWVRVLGASLGFLLVLSIVLAHLNAEDRKQGYDYAVTFEDWDAAGFLAKVVHLRRACDGFDEPRRPGVANRLAATIERSP